MGVAILITALADVKILIRNGASWERQKRIVFFTGMSVICVLSVGLTSLPQTDAVVAPFYCICFGGALFFRLRYVMSRSVPWRDTPKRDIILSDALSIIVVWMYTIVSVTFGARIVLGLLQWRMVLFELLLTAIVSSVVVLYFIFRAAQRLSGQGRLWNLGLVRHEQSLWKIVLRPALIGLGFASAAALFAITRPVQPETPLGDVLKETTSPMVIVLFVAMALFIAPVIEEIIFRGYFFSVLERIKGRVSAIIVVSVVFALLHVGQYWGDALAISVVALLGIALTWLRARTGSTWPSISTHFTYNVCVSILPVVFLLIYNPAYVRYQLRYEELTLKEKEQLLKKSLERQPYLADAYNDLAWTYCRQDKDLSQALTWVNKALSYDADRLAYLDTKVCVLRKMGHASQARQVRKRMGEAKFE
jgi:hypothetical protein